MTAEPNTEQAKQVSMHHVENLDETKLEAGEQHALQRRNEVRALNSRIVRKVDFMRAKCPQERSMLIFDLLGSSMTDGFYLLSGYCLSSRILIAETLEMRRLQARRKTSA